MADAVCDPVIEAQIYEAAFVADRWPDVLDLLSRLSGAVGGVTFASNPSGRAWTSSAALRPAMQRFVAEGWYLRNSRLAGGQQRGIRGRFVTEADLLEPGSWDTDPLYTEFFRPEGLGWSAGTVLDLAHGDQLVISVERSHAAGPVPAETVAVLDRYHPHIARAAMLAARLAFERLATAVATLQAIGLPAAAITGQNKVIATNAAWEATAGLWRIGAGDRLVLDDPRAQALLAALALLPAGSTAPRSLALSATGPEARPAVLHVLPVCGAAADLFAAGHAVLVLSRPQAGVSIPAAVVQGLFDLSPAEAEVALGIAGGASPKALARRQGKSPATVQNQLKAALRKTGCARQVDLARLFAGLSLPGRPDPL